jgi:uncharacterized protein YqgQ
MQQAMSDSFHEHAPLFRIGKENSPRLVVLTVQQIIKDFGMFGYPIRYQGKPEDAYDQISKELKLVVEETINDGYDQLFELMGKIGINEELVREKLITRENMTISETISALIMEKEFMKVYLREGNNVSL